MSTSALCPDPNDQFRMPPILAPVPVRGNAPVCISSDQEHQVSMSLDSLNYYLNSADMSEMRCVPSTVSDLLADRFKAIPNVRAVLVGESNEVHHVWVMLEEWTPEQRKVVYAAQKDILRTIRGSNFDFYVIDLPEGSDPTELVAGIPVIYQRG